MPIGRSIDTRIKLSVPLPSSFALPFPSAPILFPAFVLKSGIADWSVTITHRPLLFPDDVFLEEDLEEAQKPPTKAMVAVQYVPLIYNAMALP
mmetsp:Transcript_3666/g.5200  ORF Transcript_3666/g.5200 Transcript_3666/m.5200 type:complete len:93 (+) Transcript_3666:1130-1408(+)